MINYCVTLAAIYQRTFDRCKNVFTMQTTNEMKDKKRAWVSILLTISILSFGCVSSNEKAANAQEQAQETNKKLTEENLAYQKDMEDYKKITAEKIAANEKSIEEFNARIAYQKSEAKAEYTKKIADLNAKNSDMKKKMADFKADNKSSWESFKSEFGHDMEELGKAFRDFTVNNEK
jgi:hypothetical protein